VVLRLLADHDFNDAIRIGLVRRHPQIEVLTVRGLGMQRAPDDALLAFAATEGLLLVTHDRNTLIGIFRERARRKLPVPGVVVIRQSLSVGAAIEALELVCLAATFDELWGGIYYI
jgi:predicted nuclease of predicted toxin-antitoxin system